LKIGMNQDEKVQTGMFKALLRCYMILTTRGKFSFPYRKNLSNAAANDH